MLSVAFRTTNARIVLAISSLSFAAWFSYAYVDIFYIHLDPQGMIAFLFIGIVAVPVLAIFWVAASFLEWKAKRLS